MNILSLLRRLFSGRRANQAGKQATSPNEPQVVTLPDGQKQVTIFPVSHDLDNEIIGRHTAEMAHTHTVMVEGSLYLGGFIPADAPREKILVVLEPPSLFTKQGADHLAGLYLGGRAIPKEGRGPRGLFESIARDIESKPDTRRTLHTVYDLLYMRNKQPDVIVYNEPKLWLRTVWYESDLLFHHLLCEREFRLFGAFIYSDLDVQFRDFLEKYGNAISAMTADDCLLFAFDGRSSRDADLYTASRYIAYRALLETPGRLENAMTAAELDQLREREARMLSEVVGVNRSLIFGRRLGVRADDTPCLVFWKSLTEKRVLTIPLPADEETENRVARMKVLAADISQAAVSPDGDPLGALEKRIAERIALRSAAAKDSIGEVVRAFLKENTPPLRDRLTVEDIDNFEHVRSVSAREIDHFLDRDGYIDISEDAIQFALEKILCVPVHKKDWGGEVNDLYASNLSINGVRVPTAFLLKGNGLKRTELRIADCGKNGDQLLRLFESAAYLFVVQFVGRISEAVIADIQGKVGLRRATGMPAWFLVIDGQDTARLLYAYGSLGSTSAMST